MKEIEKLAEESASKIGKFEHLDEFVFDNRSVNVIKSDSHYEGFIAGYQKATESLEAKFEKDYQRFKQEYKAEMDTDALSCAMSEYESEREKAMEAQKQPSVATVQDVKNQMKNDWLDKQKQQAEREEFEKCKVCGNIFDTDLDDYCCEQKHPAMSLEDEAKVYLKINGLKNPPLDSGIGGGIDLPRRYASVLMAEFAYKKAAEEKLKPAMMLREVIDNVFKGYGYKNDIDFYTKATDRYDARTPVILETIAKLYANQFREEQKENNQ